MQILQLKQNSKDLEFRQKYRFQIFGHNLQTTINARRQIKSSQYADFRLVCLKRKIG